MRSGPRSASGSARTSTWARASRARRPRASPSRGAPAPAPRSGTAPVCTPSRSPPLRLGLVLPLAGDAGARGRHRPQARERDRLAAVLARAVGAGRQPRLRGVDLVERVLLLPLEPRQDRRDHLGADVLPRRAGLVGLERRELLVGPPDRPQELLPGLLQALPELVHRVAVHRPAPPARAPPGGARPPPPPPPPPPPAGSTRRASAPATCSRSRPDRATRGAPSRCQAPSSPGGPARVRPCPPRAGPRGPARAGRARRRGPAAAGRRCS